MADVEFEDFSIKVMEALDDAALRFLEEAASEIESQAQRNSRKDTGQLKGSWAHIVDNGNGKMEATIGSPLENAIWEEFGTGEYAVKGDGRKGGWYVPGDELSSKAKSHMRKITLKNGKELYFTKGKRPNRTLQRAFESKKGKIINRAKQIFKEGLG